MLKHFLVPEKDQVLVSEEKARAGTQAVFEKMGLPADEAESCADVLMTSDLRGWTNTLPSSGLKWCQLQLADDSAVCVCARGLACQRPSSASSRK